MARAVRRAHALRARRRRRGRPRDRGTGRRPASPSPYPGRPRAIRRSPSRRRVPPPNRPHRRRRARRPPARTSSFRRSAKTSTPPTCSPRSTRRTRRSTTPASRCTRRRTPRRSKLLNSGIPTIRCSWGQPSEFGLATNVSVIDAAQTAALLRRAARSGLRLRGRVGGSALHDRAEDHRPGRQRGHPRRVALRPRRRLGVDRDGSTSRPRATPKTSSPTLWG